MKDMEAVLPRTAMATPVAVPAPAPPAHPHEALMQRCQAGDAAAFEELVGIFHPRVYAVVRGILRGSNDVDDVAQQVFAKIYFSLKHFSHRSSVATWIYKIAVNECYDYLRKQKVRKAVTLADLSEEEAARIENLNPDTLRGTASLERQLEVRELADKLLARVDREDRILLVLKEIEGFSIQEVAAIMELNENTVKVRLFRARQALLTAIQRKRV